VSSGDSEQRTAGRVLVIDDQGRVLLFRGFDPTDSRHAYWFTVGGSTEPGESPLLSSGRRPVTAAQ
jgi:8-oxo-dGTP pyrophosphatase MutT (NUDIX family)